jgi:type IV pilus assembly protein PilY1
MKKSTIAIALVLLALPVTLRADTAACSLFASSYSDAILNPPTGEDSDFFVNTGGVPNLMFLLDTSGSMVRLPPDGASGGWGSFQDASNVGGSATGHGCKNAFANAIVFHSPCGALTKEALPYASSTDWANEKDASGAYCPYMTNGNQAPGTDKPGFDPDFYCGAGNCTPNFFKPAKVYHDAVLAPVSIDDGWGDWDTSPRAEASPDAFCTSVAGAGTTKETSCKACMTGAASYGYWFDGTYTGFFSAPSCGTTDDCAKHGYGTCVKNNVEYSGANDGTAVCKIPNVWFAGNFLNFYPPKFLMARKVLKDVLMSVRKVRLGLTIFDAPDGGELLKAINPGCNMIGTPSQFDSNRTALKNHINTESSVSFSNGTPLAETLLNIGQIYTTRSLPWFDSNYSKSSFQDGVSTSNNKSVCYSCQQSSVLIITDGAPSQDGNIPGSGFAASPMTKVAADTAGVYAGGAGYNIRGISATDCPVCNTTAEAADTSVPNGKCNGSTQSSGACDDSSNPIESYLPKVAWYLNNVDSRKDDENGYDNFPMEKKQTLTTYTIGLGTKGNAELILEHTAQAGGGLYNGGSDTPVVDALSLKNAIMRVLEDVNTRSTSFGAAALSPLQAAASQGVLIPRFEPSRSAHWNGHLFQYNLYSEFASGDTPIPNFTACWIPTSGPSGPLNGDYDCDGKCNSVFLMDAGGTAPDGTALPAAFIMENGTGQFVRNSPYNRASCGFGNQCTTDCAVASTDLALPIWDAGAKLSPLKVDGTAKTSTDATEDEGYTPWLDRNIYTVVDRDSDGKITVADGAGIRMVRLDDTDATATLLTSYLNIKGSTFCGDLASRLAKVTNPVATTIRTELSQSPKNYTSCARVIIQYVRGADIFFERDQASCDKAGTAPNSYCTRAYQLGDVFHSSPVEVHAPLASNGLLCDTGLDPQCLASLYRTPTPGPSHGSNANAYDDYAKSMLYRHRSKFALAGANDGLLHAIDTGTWNDTSKTYSSGTGKELWAFLPPDLLAKLRLFMGSTHHFFVDATPMVRDVWMDGVANELTSTDTDPVVADHEKQGGEFHTVAIVGERRGGTHYFALDVTDAGRDRLQKPKFLWIYPQPTDPEQLSFAETHADFTPTPPPIGPVRIDAGDPPCAAGLQTYDGGAGSRCYEEKWVVMLAGGFDPQYTKGRGVHMVDITDGSEVFDFSQPSGSGSACDAASDPRCHLNYPIAATVGMMAWGVNATFLGNSPNDFFFDTATFGDTGGQVWVLRFNEPGKRDAGTGKVTTNWFGARMFQQDKANALTCGLDYCGTQPFFHITANVPLAMNGKYRVLLGTGDRYNLLDPAGGVCSPDNLRACIQKGCSVKLDDGTSAGPGAVYGVSLLGTQSYHMDHPGFCTAENASTYSMIATAPPGGACTSVTSKISKYTIFCPASVVCPPDTGSATDETTSKTMSVTCTIDSASNTEKCEATALNDPGMVIDVKGNPDKRNWFFSMLVFESLGDRKIFSTLAQAKAYDVARLDENSLVTINLHDANASMPLGNPDGSGWKYYFDHGDPNTPDTTTIGGTSYHIYRADERVASTTGVGANCAFWNTMQPAIPPASVNTATECPINTPCKAGKSKLSYLYGAVPATGEKCLPYENTTERSHKNETLVPPHMGKLVAYLSKNQVSFGLTTVRIPQGGSNISLGQAQDISQLQQWLPVDRRTHDCRHAAKKTVAGDPAAPPTTCP